MLIISLFNSFIKRYFHLNIDIIDALISSLEKKHSHLLISVYSLKVMLIKLKTDKRGIRLPFP